MRGNLKFEQLYYSDLKRLFYEVHEERGYTKSEIGSLWRSLQSRLRNVASVVEVEG